MKTQKTDIRHYDNITKFLEACDKPVDDSWSEHTRSSRQEGKRDSWYGNVTYDGAKQMALYGWDKGLAKISESMARINKVCERRVMGKHVAGSHPDVARFIAGMPDCMNRRMASDAAKKPCLDIVLNTSYSCAVMPNDIINYGAAIASVIDELENTGYSISLVAGALSNNNDNVHTGCFINIKQQGEAMDIGKLVYFIAHTSFFRRLCFSHWEANNRYSALSNGYGVICDLPRHMQGDLYFGRQSDLSKCGTMEGALEFVKSKVSQQLPDLLDQAA